MKPDRKDTKTTLIDIQYYSSMNSFEEFYGDHVSYQEIEQQSYIEFKEILFETIHPDIKFRKYGRLGPVLTIKAEMLEEEIDNLKQMLEENKITMTHKWMVSNVTIITDKNLIDSNKMDENDDFEDFEDI